MVKLRCSLCCEKYTRKNLHTICTNCTDLDKLICSSCCSKLIQTKGVPILSTKVTTFIRCPFCRAVLNQDDIEQTTYGNTYTWYRTSYKRQKILVQLLATDRADLWDVRNSIISPLREIMLADRAFNRWVANRLLRPTQLDPDIQASFNTQILAEIEELRQRSGRTERFNSRVIHPPTT